MAKSEIAYPKLARLIAKALADSKRAGSPYTIRSASEKLRTVSTATFAAWKGGYRAPRTQNISALAELFYPNDPEKRSVFISELMSAIKPGDQQGEQRKEDSLALPLHLAAVPYDPFSLPTTKGHGFLDDFFRRLTVYGDLKSVNGFEETVLDDVGELLKEGQKDVVTGVMSTVDRNKDLRFFSTPISLPVNGVILKEHFEKFRSRSTSEPVDENSAKRELQRYLIPPDPQPGKNELHPIIRLAEVGGLYCRLALRLEPDYGTGAVTIAEKYTAESYLDALRKHTVRQGKYPVVVVDEMMCLNILTAAKGECRLVFDLNDKDAYMPRYSVGIAVPKHRSKLIDYLEGVFPVYLRADNNYLKHRYKSLYDDLCTIATSALGADSSEAKEWASRTLNLDGKDADLDFGYSRGWNNVLRATKDLLDKENAKGSAESGNETQLSE
jgi:hypothetical protein